MIQFRHLFTLISIFICSSIFAGPGDTITIQTFEYDGFPVGNGWLAPREGHFDFSAVDGLTFEKILIQYNLKCDNTQSPACGEWDYLSYIKYLNHTGKGFHPNFKVGGEGGFEPETFEYITSPAYSYSSRLEDIITYDDYDAVEERLVGTGTDVQTSPFDAASDARTYYMYTADELTAAGLTAGDMTGFQFDINAIGGSIDKMTIRIKNTTVTELTSMPSDDNFTTVFDKDHTFAGTGWQDVEFTNFHSWDGTSNIIVDIAFENSTGTTVNGSTLDWNSTLRSSGTDKFFNFNGPDVINLPVDNMGQLADEITISFWCYGNGEQPQNDSAFEGRDMDGNRIVGSHLPWSNNTVFWDAGNDTGYDRIEKVVDNETQTKGTWNHWAFTKDASTGIMKIYLNGVSWHTGTGKNLNFGTIEKFVIGRGLWNADNFYDGRIDDFRVWKKRLTTATIAEWMNKDIDSSHPNYDDLIANYTFDDDGYTTEDLVTNQMATLQGIPDRLNYAGDRFKGFTSSMERPNIKFIRNSGNYNITTQVVVDQTEMGQIMLETYVQNNPGEKPELDQTLYVYPPYYTDYVYDANGIATDSIYIGPEVTLDLVQIEYNTTTVGEEIIKPMELGRFITPYGNGLTLGNDGWTWSFDVSDFQQFLNGSDVHLQAGNFQELLNMKFIFIEGTPPRNVLDIQNLYSANPQLSNFDNEIVDTTVQLMPEAKMFKIKSTVSGHWFGQGANCGEFCPNVHKIQVNGTTQYAWQIMQECGDNPLFPQGGTWMYDRAGWCPGMPVTEQNVDITEFINVGTDTEVTVDYDINFDPYGNYVTEIYFVSYDDPNFDNDVSLEEIISPNNLKTKGRFNPICGKPIIKVKNTGANLLTSFTVNYGVDGGTMQSYEWTGFLEFNEDRDIELPELIVGDYMAGSQSFTATVSNPNGGTDEYVHNNMRRASFEAPPLHTNEIIIMYKTNFSPGQNNYKVYNTDGSVAFSRTGFLTNTFHYDTINLAPGCYEFKAFDTAGDGMNNWPANSGDGSIWIKNGDGSMFTQLEAWFGSFLSYRFSNIAPIDANENITKSAFKIFPNPSTGQFHLAFSEDIGDFTIDVFDLAGKRILTGQNFKNSTGYETLDLSNLGDGFYLINIKSETFNISKKVMVSH